MTRATDVVIADLQRQVAQQKGYLSLALDEGHGMSVVLFLLPDGKLGSPKVSIDTRGDVRGGKR